MNFSYVLDIIILVSNFSPIKAKKGKKEIGPYWEQGGQVTGLGWGNNH